MSKHNWRNGVTSLSVFLNTTCIKVSDFSLYKGVSYNRLCDFAHLSKIGNYVNLARCQNFLPDV